jgi:hypothetical protein
MDFYTAFRESVDICKGYDFEAFFESTLKKKQNSKK